VELRRTGRRYRKGKVTGGWGEGGGKAALTLVWGASNGGYSIEEGTGNATKWEHVSSQRGWDIIGRK